MISLAVPAFFYAALGAAAAILALHVLASKKPQLGLLPTARFFPDVPARATALTPRLSDLMLLVIRLATVLSVGLALARPTITLRRQTVMRLVATSHGSLSSALIEALREAGRVRARADSFELVIMSPLTTDEIDAATPEIRSLWPGRIRLERTATPPEGRAVTARLEWADSASNRFWRARDQPDTVGSFGTGELVLTYPFERRWQRAAPLDSMRVVARWVDGAPAVVERMTGGSCVRSLGMSLPTEGDAPLRPELVAFARWLALPCRDGPSQTLASDSIRRMLEGPVHLAASSDLPASRATVSPLTIWLLLIAAALALFDVVARRRQ